MPSLLHPNPNPPGSKPYLFVANTSRYSPDVVLITNGFSAHPPNWSGWSEYRIHGPVTPVSECTKSIAHGLDGEGFLTPRTPHDSYSAQIRVAGSSGRAERKEGDLTETEVDNACMTNLTECVDYRGLCILTEIRSLLVSRFHLSAMVSREAPMTPMCLR